MNSPSQRLILARSTNLWARKSTLRILARNSIRFLSGPPRKSFISSTDGFKVFWYNKVPRTLTYWTGILGGCITIANVHPEYLITVGPPIGVLGYFGYNKLIEHQYNKQVQTITPTTYQNMFQNVVDIPRYDEQDYHLVLKGIETEYDHFKDNVYRIIKQQINENIMKFESEFLDSNSQVLINLGDIENFITLSVNIDFAEDSSLNQDEFHQNLAFIKLGIPFFNKDNSKRLGIIECYLLELPVQKEDSISYKLKLMVYPYKLTPFSTSRLYIID